MKDMSLFWFFFCIRSFIYFNYVVVLRLLAAMRHIEVVRFFSYTVVNHLKQYKPNSIASA